MNPPSGGALAAADLPVGSAPAPVPLPHFPGALHAFVWRNWQVVPLERIARVVEATRDEILALGQAMGLTEPPPISADQQRRSALTVIRRNWHLLPYEQLLHLLGWSADELAWALQEDDFLFHKLGRLKPRCEPVRFRAPDEPARRRAAEIAAVVHAQFPSGAVDRLDEPLFQFVADLSRPPEGGAAPEPSVFSPRYCYSYFALYGDPLLEPELDPFPDGFLARLARSGVDGVWLQGVVYKLARFPWQPELSDRFEERLANLRDLVARAARHGIGIYLYLNEPRSMPVAFYEAHPELRGVPEGEYAALCTSVPEVREYLAEAVASVCRAVPDLAGLFTITASENLTNCWSKHRGGECPRCAERVPADVIAEVNGAIREGMRRAASRSRLIAWDWGWPDDQAERIIAQLPADVSLMSVSEWSIPINRGGTDSIVGEYSISVVGPGPRARRHWEWARARGLRVMAKIQAGCTWELSAVPYIPAVENVARHVANLREAGVDGLMLGWTLGGYPSPNLEVVAEIGAASAGESGRVGEWGSGGVGEQGKEADLVGPAMERVARCRFGDGAAPAVVVAWRRWCRAFSEFPYHGSTVYNAPLQVGPANLLWSEPTGYRSTMVGTPYDDLKTWRAVYPPGVFAGQLEKVAGGFDAGLAELRRELAAAGAPPRSAEQEQELAGELRVAEAAALHFRSVANQSRFVSARDALAAATGSDEREEWCAALERLLREEIALAVRLYEIQRRDTRIGFEATNQYYYVPLDLAEKVINCRDLLERWLPGQRKPA